ncbi:MAG TPA: CHAT domain-containing protein, partial [Trebonia sp.]|nr:CHAT domain-containing protein [Trebonia sp.]
EADGTDGPADADRPGEADGTDGPADADRPGEADGTDGPADADRPGEADGTDGPADAGGAERVTLVTCGLLGGLPLHAALLPEAGREPATDCYALDRVLVSYAANARSLTSASAVRDRLTAGSLLSIADPDTPHGKRLPAASAEAGAVGRHFPDDRRVSLGGATATSEAVLRALGQADVLHAACHAISDPASPMESALILSGGARLTVRELSEQRILADGGGLRLAVLSACESAVIGQAAPDEAIGLPAALIEAGAAAVVASLVVVPDSSTALLMARFYDCWLTDGVPPPEALRRAQRWLRDVTNEELLTRYPDLLADVVPAEGFRRRLWERARAHRHPTRWAAFVHIGLLFAPIVVALGPPGPLELDRWAPGPERG